MLCKNSQTKIEIEKKSLFKKLPLQKLNLKNEGLLAQIYESNLNRIKELFNIKYTDKDIDFIY